MGATVQQMVGKYVELRERRTELKKKFTASDNELKDMQGKIETFLQGKMDADGVKSFATPSGTAYSTHIESIKVGDWESFFGYVLENEAYDLLTHNVNKTACRDIMQPDRNGNYSEPPPPGVDITRIKTVNIRK